VGKTAAGVRDSWRHRIPVGHSSSDQPINLFRRLDLCLTNTHDFQVTPLKTLKFNTYNNTYFYDPVVLATLWVVKTSSAAESCNIAAQFLIAQFFEGQGRAHQERTDLRRGYSAWSDLFAE